MKLKKRNKAILYIYSVVALLVIITFHLGSTVLALNGAKEGILCEGIYVSGIDLGGKSLEEAKNLVKEQIETIKAKKVFVEIVSDGEVKHSEEVTVADLGFEAAGEEIIEEVSSIGTEGNLITRYKALKDVKEKKINHQLHFRYDESKLDTFVEGIKTKYNVEAEDATLKRENGKFIVSGGKTGIVIDDGAVLSEIKTSVSSFIEGLPETINSETKIQAELKVVKPKYDKEDLAKVTDLLGTYSTFYGAGVTGRTLNIVNGCKLINGSLLLPGESVSANKKMAPYTLGNGYHIGGAYLNGKVVDDIGGGICQVSTTLYNAALYSEIDIVARQNHSMTVGYVPLARDAAIAGDFKDLVIKNNREYPIYVEGITHGGKITFNIYGHETRDVKNRKIDFETVTLQSIAPGKEIVTEDPTQPEDYEKVTQGAWTGYKTELYKVVKVNGVQTERTLVNKSNYRSNPRYVIRGTKKVEEKDKKKDKKEDEKKKPKKKVEKPVPQPEEDTEEDVSEEEFVEEEVVDDGFEDDTSVDEDGVE